MKRLATVSKNLGFIRMFPTPENGSRSQDMLTNRIQRIDKKERQ